MSSYRIAPCGCLVQRDGSIVKPCYQHDEAIKRVRKEEGRMKVACERPDGLLNVHDESELCDMCRPTVLTFHPRFIREQDLPALSNLWHLSAVATSQSGDGYRTEGQRRYTRLLWTSQAFYDDPTLLASSPTAVYKDLCAMLEFGGR